MIPAWIYFIVAGLIAALIIVWVRLQSAVRTVRDMSQQLLELSGLDGSSQIRLTHDDKLLGDAVRAVNDALQRLRQEKVRLGSADAALRSALSGWSHDLRTPLTAVRGYVSLLEREPQTESGRRCLDVISRRLAALEATLEDLFSFSLALSAEGALKEEVTDLTACAEEACAAFIDGWERSWLAVDVQMPDDKVPVHASGQALSRVLYNLFSNASKYAHRFVSVLLTDEGVLTVENDAEELDPIVLQVLLNPASPITVVSPAGAGLGLATARLLCDKMGADLTASWQDGTLRICIRFGSPQQT